jgi:hypothetical protein
LEKALAEGVGFELTLQFPRVGRVTPDANVAESQENEPRFAWRHCSSFTFADWMTPAHFSTSLFISRPKSAFVLGATLSTRLLRRALTTGSDVVSLIAIKARNDVGRHALGRADAEPAAGFALVAEDRRDGIAQRRGPDGPANCYPTDYPASPSGSLSVGFLS